MVQDTFYRDLYVFAKKNNVDEIKKFYEELQINETDKKIIINNSFIYSVKENDLDTAEKLLESGADIDVYNHYILCYAIKYRNMETIKFLVKRGADIKAEFNRPLRMSCRLNHNEIVKYLLENGVCYEDNDYEAVRFIVKNDNLEILKLFVENGLDISKLEDKIQYNMLYYAFVVNKSKETYNYMIKQGANGKLFMQDKVPIQVYLNNVEFVENAVIENRFDIHFNDEEALYWAVYQNNIELVKILLNAGADPNARNGDIINVACRDGFVEILNLLISKKANINNECMNIAIENGRKNIISCIISNKNKKRKRCDTPPTVKKNRRTEINVGDIS